MATSPREGVADGAAVEERFEAVFGAEFSYVCRTLRRLGVAERDIEDVAQEVFVTVFRRFAEYDAGRPVRPWLFSFALRVAANHRRLARHRREVPEGREEPPSRGLGPEAGAERREAQALVHRALENLEMDRRAVLVMHDIDEFSVPEIAEVLSVNVNTVYSRLRLARRDFEKAVKRLRARGSRS